MLSRISSVRFGRNSAKMAAISRIFGPWCTPALVRGEFSAQRRCMDTFDAKILEAVQQNARLTAEALSETVGLSPDACRKRLAKLRASGVIEAEIAIVRPEKVGRGLMLIVEVSLQNERKADLDRFKQRMSEAPEVMQCYYVTGNSDFVLILSVRDMADYDAFSRQYFFEEDNVVRFRTSAVMDRVKVGFSVPVKPAG